MIFFIVDIIRQTMLELKETVYGLRSTVYGLRSTVYGLRSLNNRRNYPIIITLFTILLTFSACGGGGGGSDSGAPIIMTTSLQDGAVGESYSQTLTATGTAPITWSIWSGDLPDGLSLNPTEGTISGTPTKEGIFYFTVEAENSKGWHAKDLSIEIILTTGPPNIKTVSLPNGVLGVAYNSQPLAATGTAPITWSIDSGNLPDGLSLNSTDGTISGTPTNDDMFYFTIKATNSEGSSTKTFFTVITVTHPYIINGTYGIVTVTKSGVTIGTPNQTIQNGINAIKAHANGNDCEIQFGNGTEFNSYNYVDFDGSGSLGWGKITLLGRISQEWAIRLQNGVSIDIKGEIICNGYSSGVAVSNNSTGVLTISGGTVSGTIRNNSNGAVIISGGTVSETDHGWAIHNASSGAVNISGGTVSATDGRAIYNASSGAVNISGGTVSATTGNAVCNSSTGKITVSGTALVTSANDSVSIGGMGTIRITSSASGSSLRLEITGGKVENTADNGEAIYNGGNSDISISGGTVSGTILNDSSGAVNISGGTVSATTSRAIYNSGSGKITISGTAFVTSAYTSTSSGTIHLGAGSGSGLKLEMTGGTVQNTTSSGRAIYNDSIGSVIIYAGTVSTTSSYSVYNNSSIGVVTIYSPPTVINKALTYGTINWIP